MPGTKKYLSKINKDNTDIYIRDLEAVSAVSYDSTNNKITKTINNTTSDIVTAATIVDGGGGTIAAFVADDTNYPDITSNFTAPSNS